jgi:hypothetical protein
LRWILDGVKTPRGVARLEGLRLGGRWLTSVEALQRFAAEQTPSFDAGSTALLQTPAAHRRASERAAKKLDEIGI